MLSPAPTDGNMVEHRRDTRITLEIEIRTRSMGVNLPWDFIRIPRTKSVKHSVTGNKKALDFRLELQGATTGTLHDSLCRTCALREPRNSLVPRTLVDFTSKTDAINLKNGKAEVTFRFLCLSTHHGPADSEYRINAIISNGDEIVAQHALETCLRVTSRGAKRKNRNIDATRTSPIVNFARSSEDQFQVSAGKALEPVATNNATTSTSTLGANMSGIDFPLSPSRVLPDPLRTTSPITVQPATQNLDSNTGAGNGGVSFISLLIPSCGTISGGEQIVLVVNLPPSATLFARFGDNIASTFCHAPGILVCNLPPAAQPGTVEVTLSRTPSLGAPTYARSLAKFTYESDANRAATHILKIRDEALRSEAMPFIQRVFQSHGNRGPASDAPQASSSHRGVG